MLSEPFVINTWTAVAGGMCVTEPCRGTLQRVKYTHANIYEFAASYYPVCSYFLRILMEFREKKCTTSKATRAKVIDAHTKLKRS